MLKQLNAIVKNPFFRRDRVSVDFQDIENKLCSFLTCRVVFYNNSGETNQGGWIYTWKLK